MELHNLTFKQELNDGLVAGQSLITLHMKRVETMRMLSKDSFVVRNFTFDSNSRNTIDDDFVSVQDAHRDIGLLLV